MPGILSQVNISNGGMPKHPVLMAQVTRDGVAGDRQRNGLVHGGPNRAVCLYSEELYAWLRDNGVKVSNGDIGENFTTRDIDLLAIKPGDRLRVGECLIEITKIRKPCKNLTQWHPDLVEIILGRSGWLAKVVEEAVVKPGDLIELASGV